MSSDYYYYFPHSMSRVIITIGHVADAWWSEYYTLQVAGVKTGITDVEFTERSIHGWDLRPVIYWAERRGSTCWTTIVLVIGRRKCKRRFGFYLLLERKYSNTIMLLTTGASLGKGVARIYIECGGGSGRIHWWSVNPRPYNHHYSTVIVVVM